MKILETYKNRNCKTWLGKILQRIICTTTYKLVIFLLFIISGGIISNFTNDSNIVNIIMIIGIYGIIIIFLNMILFAWIINPITNFIKNKKK